MPDRNKSVHTSRELRMRARELRKQAAPAGKILWKQLRDKRLLGLKFRRQHLLGTHIVDFNCPAQRLVVEIDGEIHRYQEAKDQLRTDQLEEKGYKVIRFWNYEVEQHLDTVLDTIVEKCDLASPKAGRRTGDEGKT